jgi:hypothetical protein
MGLGGQRQAPGRFTLEKDPVPIVKEAGWASEPVWTCAKNPAPTGIRSPDRPARNESLYLLRYPGSKTKQKQNRTKKQKKVKLMSTRTHTHTHTHTQTHAPDNTRTFCQTCFVLSTVSGQLQWSEYIIMALQGKWRWWSGHVHGCGWLYIPPIKNNKRKNKRRLCVSPRLSKRKINVQVCSVLEVLNPYPQHTAKYPHCAETSLQAVKHVTQQKPFIFTDRRRDSAELQKTQ